MINGDFRDTINNLSNADVIFANSALHYFDKDEFKEILIKIKNKLNPKGFLVFANKSKNDGLFGRGKKIRDDVWEFENRTRYFFSETEITKILKDVGFKVLQSCEDQYQLDGESHFLVFVAQHLYS